MAGRNDDKITEYVPAEMPGGRLTGETDKAFQAFTLFREMGLSRTVSEVARQLRVSRQNVARWVAVYHWRERITEWDDFADVQMRRRDLVEREAGLKAMRERHTKIAQTALTVVEAELDVLVTVRAAATKKAGKKGGEPVAPLSAQEIARLMQVASSLERLSRGESTERLEVREAAKYADKFIEVALTYIPLDSHDAFFTDIDNALGTGHAEAASAA